MNQFDALAAFAETVGGAPLTPWQRRALAVGVENAQRRLENTLLYGDPETRTRPAPPGLLHGDRPTHVVFDEAADFDKGRHAVALRKLHKEKVTGAIMSAPV